MDVKVRKRSGEPLHRDGEEKGKGKENEKEYIESGICLEQNMDSFVII